MAIILSDLVESETEAFFSLRLRTSVYDPLQFARYNVAGDGHAWSYTCAAGNPCAHTLATMWTQRIVRSEEAANGSVLAGLVSRPGMTRKRQSVVWNMSG